MSVCIDRYCIAHASRYGSTLLAIVTPSYKIIICKIKIKQLNILIILLNLLFLNIYWVA